MDNKNILEVIELLKGTSQFINDSRANLCAPYGLSHIQAIIILDIYHNSFATKITDICKRLNKTTNTISPLINRLISKGLIYKTQNKQDNRVFEVFLTEEGQKMMEKINKDVIKFAEPLFASLKDDEYENLKTSLEVLSKVCGLN